MSHATAIGPACLAIIVAAAEPPASSSDHTPPASPAPSAPSPRAAPTDAGPQTRTFRIPNTTVDIELVKVPAPPGVTPPPGGSLWVARTETTWDQYDVFVYGLDVPGGTNGATGADAVARPSKPYVPPDRGFGHSGFPAMGMTHHGATSYCAWLTSKLAATLPAGARFRLPTEAEWEYLALAGDDGAFACASEPACLAEVAWFADNSDRSTKRVGQKQPNAFGLLDVHGNVAEWVAEAAPAEGQGPKPKPLAKGGSYLDGPERCAVQFDLRQTSAWNASDPQIPKSTWWLADCPFVGFRVVLEEPTIAPP